ncbi:YtxH domain-containing protein [Virgibacillus kekensis]|uniref:YtxH domain-containing protein n=1 Tax=Virgibacillus kekensis TaxID=202261 RepID=A0ABV9DGV2_9BACI
MAEQQQKMNWKQKEVVTGVVAGVAAGAATALVVAPKSGKDFRSDLTNQVNTGKERFGNACRTQFSTLKENTSKKTQQLKSKMQRQRKEAPGDGADYKKEKYANQNPGELHSNSMADAQGDNSQRSEDQEENPKPSTTN